MKSDFTKIGIALLCSSFLLTGCLKNENPDATPPSEEIPGETPDDLENPGTDGPGTGDPETPQTPEDSTPVDGEPAFPYSEGVGVNQILESKSGGANLLRSIRLISGNTITFEEQEKLSQGGAWSASSDELPWYFLSETPSSSSFFEMKPEAYSLDTSNYTISVNNTDFEAAIDHKYYDAQGQGIQDFATANLEFTNLSALLDSQATFDGSAYVYIEDLILNDDITMYYEGANDGTNCLDPQGNPLNESIATSGNCNIVADVNGDAHALIDDMIDTTEVAAPIVYPNSIVNTQIKLIADDGTFTAGNVYGVDAAGNIGRFTKETLADGVTEVLQVEIYNTDSYNWYDESTVEWANIKDLYFVRDNQRIRMAVKIPVGTGLKVKSYLLNHPAFQQLEDAVNW